MSSHIEHQRLREIRRVGATTEAYILPFESMICLDGIFENNASTAPKELRNIFVYGGNSNQTR